MHDDKIKMMGKPQNYEQNGEVSNSALLPCSLTLGKDISDMERSLACLYLEVPSDIMDDIMNRWKAVKSHLPKQ